ncbi:unnamed protein product, partial [Brassica oleracea]
LSFLHVLFLFHPILSIDVNTLSSTDSLTISSNRTLVSHGGVFELGFFKPSALSRWYLGIWYKKLVSDKTYAWVANRDNPLSTSSGSLKISGNNLVLLGQFNNCVWSTNITRGKSTSPVMAELLPNGNLVMRYSYNNDSPSGFLWQSFDFPTDTLLPDMKLGYDHKTGRNRFLTSWRNFDDPSSGDFTYKFDVRRGLPELFLKKKYVVMERSGPWTGIEFSGIPVGGRNHPVYDYIENSEEVTIRLLIANQSIYLRLTIIDLGYLHRSTLIPPSRGWSYLWTFPTDDCDAYKSCGPYAYCDLSTSPRCNCFEGFDPMNRQQWDLGEGSDGCVRRTPLSCSGNRFLMLRKMKLPDAKMSIADRIIDLKKCEERCLTDCNCTSFAAADVRRGVTGCFIWTGELYDTRTYYFAGQDLYVKVANVDLVLSSDEERDRNGKIIRWSIGVSLMLILSVIVFCFWKRGQKQAKLAETPIVLMNRMVLPRQRNLSGDNHVEDLEVPLIEFEDLEVPPNIFLIVTRSEKVALVLFTRYICSHLSPYFVALVIILATYFGRLLDGQEIAVKRLSEMSAQGTNEFMNEVRLIARLQHINLVQLLGCCVDEGEKILIYEYLDNLSLDSHLFDLTRRRMLNWQMRFDIINGIARGILYLHHDSSIRIIHRDLKASNILLDKDMTPKISDFGMARIFGRDETEANTRKVVGTYFGVLLLEIISGKRNKGFYYSCRDYNLLECVWRNWKEGQGLAIVDTVIIDSSSPTFRPREILRCLQIALLCVQARVEDRPLMSSVVLMLGSEAEDIPQPKPPGYCVIGNFSETYSTWSKQPDNEACTVNQITMSIIDAR